VAGVAQGGNPVVMGFDAHSLSIPLLIGVGGNHRAILCPTDLTG